jgi:hypothetical protein
MAAVLMPALSLARVSGDWSGALCDSQGVDFSWSVTQNTTKIQALA